MNFKTFHSFARADKHYCFDAETLLARSVEPGAARLLREAQAGPGTRCSPELQDLLASLDLLAEPLSRPARAAEVPPLKALTLLLTQRCNLDCVYCYAKTGTYGREGEMSEKTARLAIDWLIRQAEGRSKLSLSFFGGEPFLNFPLLRGCVEYAKRQGQAAGKQFSFSLTTNATLLDEERVNWILNEAVQVLVSCDGPPEIHDAARPRPARAGGSFSAMSEGLARLLEHRESLNLRLAARAIWRGNCDPRTVRDALRRLGFSEISISLASPSLFTGTGEPKQERDLSGLLELSGEEADWLLERVKARDHAALRFPRLGTPMLRLLQALLNRQKNPFFCGSGRHYLAVSCEGELYPCQRFVGQPEYCLGQLNPAPPRREPVFASPAAQRAPCRSCFAKHLCAGGCKHDNLAMTGSTAQPAPDYCRLMRGQLEIAVALSLDLDASDRAWLLEYKIVKAKPCPLDF